MALRTFLLAATLAASPLGAARPDEPPGPPAEGVKAEEPAAAPRAPAGREWFGFPIAYYTPETHLGYGVLGGVDFRVKPGLDVSDVQAIVSGTTRQQAFLSLTSLVFPTDRVAVGGSLRLFDFPDYFWGVGSDTPSSAKEAFTSRYVEALLTGEWYVVPRLRTGPRAWFRQESLLDLQPGGALATGGLPGSEGYAAPGVGWGVVWDTRDSRFFPHSGSDVEAWYLYAWRIDRAASPFGRASFDARRFQTLGHGIVLGLAGHLEVAHGEVPVTLLPRLGGDQYLRGYYYGRWRDRVMYSGQAELRVPIVWRLLATAFGGVSDVAPSFSSFGAATIRPAGGVGARLRLSEQGLNVRFDVGVGQEGANVYFALGEAF
jgi:hypothetical protein